MSPGPAGLVLWLWCPPMKRKSSGRAAKAIRTLHKAARIANTRPVAFGDEILNRRKAKQAVAEAQDLLEPAGHVVKGAGEAALWDPDPQEKISPRDETALAHDRLVDTLEHPNSVSVRASEQRMEAAAEAGVLEAATDAAVSAQAENSLEKMLCHQMAAAHHTAMKLVTRAGNDTLEPVDTTRLTNGAARLMQVFQEGLLALRKFRNGGKQQIVVQHVQVSEGGQAVIAGRVGGPPNGEAGSD